MLNTRDAAPPMSDVANDALGNLGREVDRAEPTQQQCLEPGLLVKAAAYERSRWSLPANWE